MIIRVSLIKEMGCEWDTHWGASGLDVSQSEESIRKLQKSHVMETGSEGAVL